jgi:glycosyltransferase involved in cell wall biosynthesis
MNILHVGKYYPPFRGGMESYLKDLVEEQKKNHNLTVIVHNHKFKSFKSSSESSSEKNLKLIRLSSLKPILFTPIMLGLNKLFNKSHENQAFDLIHISWPNPSALFLLLNKKAKSIPWVIQWQSDMVTKHSSLLLKFAYWFFRPLEKRLLNHATKVIVSSKEYLQHSNALKDFEDKCEIISLALKDREKNNNTKDIEWANRLWKNQNTKIFNIGRLTFYKNHELLINAASKLPEVQFIITGSGQLSNKLNQIIKTKGINNVVMTQGLSDSKINALFATCDAFCLPSNDRAESFGLVLLEALQFKKNILVSNLAGSGMRWIASQTPLGTTFDCNDVDDLVEKINALEPPKVPATEIPEVFKIETCAKSIDSLYQEVVNKAS